MSEQTKPAERAADSVQRPGSEIPHRRFRLEATIEADTIEELGVTLDNMSYAVVCDRTPESIMGGCSGSWAFKVIENPEMTPEAYRSALHDYLQPNA